MCMEQQRLSDPQADKVWDSDFYISSWESVDPTSLWFRLCCLISARVDFLFQMRVRKIAPKILQLLTEWTETFPYDFRDERMMRSLKELTHRLASGDEVSSIKKKKE